MNPETAASADRIARLDEFDRLHLMAQLSAEFRCKTSPNIAAAIAKAAAQLEGDVNAKTLLTHARSILAMTGPQGSIG